MKLMGAIAIGFILDLVFGDPQGLLHPVQIIGWFITAFKELTWKVLYGCNYQEMKRQRKKRKKGAEKVFGFLIALIIVPSTYIVVWQIMNFAEMIHPIAKFVVEALLIYQIFATKSLKTESMKVYRKLKSGSFRGARRELSYLVGRDTQELDKEEVIKADVETIAENIADGVIAPMFFVALGGAPLGFAYKAANTLDSMLGYRNKEYQNIGFASAKFDDIWNFIPARLAALLMIIACAILRLDVANAWKIFRRDRYNHLSPNSAQTESVVAGALGLQLGGTHTYFGKVVKKPTIGDAKRRASVEDIRKTNNILYVTACINLVISIGIAALIQLVIIPQIFI